MDSPVTVFFFIAVQVFNFLNPNGASCCLLKHVMFLFVKVEGEKSEGIACLPAQCCTSFSLPTTQIAFVNTSTYIHKFPYFRRNKQHWS